MRLVSQLKYLGTVQSASDLRKLITYHDANRRFPTEALLPGLHTGPGGRQLPNVMTIDEARQILRDENWRRRLLANRSRSYYHKQIRPFEKQIGFDAVWLRVWRRLSDLEKRMATALFALTESMLKENRDVSAITASLPVVEVAPKLPFLAWHKKLGVGIVEEWLDDSEEGVNVWLWRTNDFVISTLDQWRSVIAGTEDEVLAAEMDAFWPEMPWYSGPRRFQRTNRNRQTIIQVPIGSRSSDAHKWLREIPPFQKLADLMQFETGQRATLASCLRWIKNQLKIGGTNWTDFESMLKQYSSNPNARANVDRIVQLIAQAVAHRKTTP